MIDTEAAKLRDRIKQETEDPYAAGAGLPAPPTGAEEDPEVIRP